MLLIATKRVLLAGVLCWASGRPSTIIVTSGGIRVRARPDRIAERVPYESLIWDATAILAQHQDAGVYGPFYSSTMPLLWIIDAQIMD